METTTRKRKSSQQIQQELEDVITLLKNGATALEIEAALNLSAVQFKNLLAKAAMNGVAATRTQYVTVRSSSLPDVIRRLYGASPKDVFRFDPPDQNGGHGFVRIIHAQPEPGSTIEPDESAAANGELLPEAGSSANPDEEDHAAEDNGFEAAPGTSCL